jgi:hypothetical protein
MPAALAYSEFTAPDRRVERAGEVDPRQPGVWTSKSLAETSSLGNDIKKAIKVFEQAAKLIQAVLLSTVPSQDWDGINPLNRKRLLSGLTATDKQVLELPLV